MASFDQFIEKRPGDAVSLAKFKDAEAVFFHWEPSGVTMNADRHLGATNNAGNAGEAA